MKDYTRTARTYIIIHKSKQHVNVSHATCFYKENRSKFFVIKKEKCVLRVCLLY
jgi:hypothetical protein